jgi:hypothetical protein
MRGWISAPSARAALALDCRTMRSSRSKRARIPSCSVSPSSLKKGGLAFQADKNDYRGLLAGLEGITGKKAVDSDAMNVKN